MQFDEVNTRLTIVIVNILNYSYLTDLFDNEILIVICSINQSAKQIKDNDIQAGQL